MKKIFFLVLLGFFLGQALAYEPTLQDITQVNSLKTQLDTTTSDNMKYKRDFYAQIKTLQEQFTGHAQLAYHLDQLAVYLITQINTEKVKAKSISKVSKQYFLDSYMSWFSQDITTPDSCTWRYNTMDSISFANNFPTALMIATRYRELNCGYYLHNNGDGPFQILSKNYGSEQITEATFIRTMQDFIDFSKSKYQMYKTKLWISLTYTWFTWTGLVSHWALYNGATITWDVINGYSALPNNPRYVYDGYGQTYSWAIRYGVVPKFLKILDWELKNTY